MQDQLKGLAAAFDDVCATFGECDALAPTVLQWKNAFDEKMAQAMSSVEEAAVLTDRAAAAAAAAASAGATSPSSAANAGDLNRSSDWDTDLLTLTSVQFLPVMLSVAQSCARQLLRARLGEHGAAADELEIVSNALRAVQSAAIRGGDVTSLVAVCRLHADGAAATPKQEDVNFAAAQGHISVLQQLQREAAEGSIAESSVDWLAALKSAACKTGAGTLHWMLNDGAICAKLGRVESSVPASEAVASNAVATNAAVSFCLDTIRCTESAEVLRELLPYASRGTPATIFFGARSAFETCLEHAAENGLFDAVSALLDASMYGELLSHADDACRGDLSFLITDVLESACMLGDIAVVRAILSASLPVALRGINDAESWRCPCGRSDGLSLAVGKGHDELAALLLEDPRIRINRSTLVRAAKAGNTPIFSKLLHDPRISAADIACVLTQSVMESTARVPSEIVQMCLDHPLADPSRQQHLLVVRAALGSHADHLKLILSHPRGFPCTEAIVCAARNSDHEVLRVLLE